ncbi:hypothetical protein ACFFQW_04110 [Umezawaea endophytica]|uniref:Ribulose 1,5-bisphosphate carboxylase large subunit n=1 Tax=Umezawaea endophytica TaxID=1654476 RepID=A0A9X2VMI0_9PSEU|nr:hypothetical protein [Umezawaea endophytica]MCS7479335.1 hypothetical protein [Umezawaea endophytica]
MELRLPDPGALFGLAKSTVGWAVDSAVAVAAVPGRVLGLLDAAESLVGRVDDVVTRADTLVRKTEAVVDEVTAVVENARAVSASAQVVVADARRVSTAAEAVVTEVVDITSQANGVVVVAESTARTAHELLEAYSPLARQAMPLLRRFVDELSPQEIEAAIKLVDQLPVITEHVLSDVLPILATLDKVGPDVHQLLEVTNDVRQAILGIPGFNFLRKRGVDKDPENGEE